MRIKLWVNLSVMLFITCKWLTFPVLSNPVCKPVPPWNSALLPGLFDCFVFCRHGFNHFLSSFEALQFKSFK